jgi:hypothetical protein
MGFVNATRFYRKSGGAKPRDLQFRGPFLETCESILKQIGISTGAYPDFLPRCTGNDRAQRHQYRQEIPGVA